MSDESNKTTQETSPVDQLIQTFEAKIRADPNQIPDKYRRADPEESIKAAVQGYAELYRGFTQKAQEAADLRKQLESQQAKAPEPSPEVKGETPLGLPDPPKSDGPDLWKKVETAVSRTGELPDDLRKMLVAQGIPDTIINATLSGYQAQRKQILTEAAQLCGGDENLAAIQSWAASTLSPEERQTTHMALQSPAWKTTLLGLKSRWEADRVTKNEPKPTPAGAPVYGKPGLKPFGSKQEQLAAFSDPRYQMSPEYRQEVTERLWLTNNPSR
jgi:hypothetical protein